MENIEKLVMQSKEGDIKAKEELITRLKPLICSKFRLAKKELDREDIYQEACLCILECIENYDSEKKIPFLAYVKKAVTYRIWALNKSSKSELSLEGMLYEGITLGDTINSPDTPFEEVAEQKEEVNNLRICLGRLSKKQSKVLRKHFFEGKMLKDIALEQGVHPLGVLRLKNRAIRKLKESLEKCIPE